MFWLSLGDTMKNKLSYRYGKFVVLLLVISAFLIENWSIAFAETTTTTVGLAVRYLQTDARTEEQLINQFRQSEDAWYWNSCNTEKVICSGLGTLTWDYELEKICMQRAAELAVSYGHDRPDGESCFTAYDELGYYAGYCGENIAAGYGFYSTTAEVFRAWREDDCNYSGQGHRRNMLNSNYTRFACAGVYYNGVYYWVQEFSDSTAVNTASPANDSETYMQVTVLTADISTQINTDLETVKISAREKTSLPQLTFAIKLPNSWPQNSWTDYDWNSVDMEYSFEITDTSIASIEDGMICGLKPGSSVLRITAPNAEKDIVITVSEAEINEKDTTSQNMGGIAQYDSDGVWRYYSNNAVDYSFNGFAGIYGTQWLFQNGILNFNYTGFYYDGAQWWKVSGGRQDSSYTGLAYDANMGWWYVNNGVIDFNYYGLAYDQNLQDMMGNGWWYVYGGQLDFGYYGLGYHESIGWWKVTGGQLDASYTGLAYDSQMGWWNVINGTIVFNTYGMVYDAGLESSTGYGWWYVNGGKLDFNYFGLGYNESIGWWKVTGGHIDSTYTGLSSDTNCGWWYVGSGTIDFGFSGMYADAYFGTHAIVNGKVSDM